MSLKQLQRCSKCDHPGHNARGCGREDPDGIRASDREKYAANPRRRRLKRKRRAATRARRRKVAKAWYARLSAEKRDAYRARSHVSKRTRWNAMTPTQQKRARAREVRARRAYLASLSPTRRAQVVKRERESSRRSKVRNRLRTLGRERARWLLDPEPLRAKWRRRLLSPRRKRYMRAYYRKHPEKYKTYRARWLEKKSQTKNAAE